MNGPLASTICDLEAEAFHRVLYKQLHFWNNGAAPAIKSTSDAVDLAVPATLMANFFMNCCGGT